MNNADTQFYKKGLELVREVSPEIAAKEEAEKKEDEDEDEGE